MTQLTITWIGQKKDITTKYGVRQKNSLKAKEHNDNYLDFWCSPTTDAWKIGDVVEVLEVKPREYNGKTYHDIFLPKANGGDNTEIAKKLEEVANQNAKILIQNERIISGLADVHKAVVPKSPSKVAGTDLDYPEMDETNNAGIEIDEVDF